MSITMTAVEIDSIAAYGPLKDQAKYAIQLEAQLRLVSGDEVLSVGGALLQRARDALFPYSAYGAMRKLVDDIDHYLSEQPSTGTETDRILRDAEG